MHYNCLIVEDRRIFKGNGKIPHFFAKAGNKLGVMREEFPTNQVK